MRVYVHGMRAHTAVRRVHVYREQNEFQRQVDG